MAKLKKIQVKELFNNGDICLEGDINEVIKNLMELRDKAETDYPEYELIEVEIDSGHEIHSIEVYGTRLETDSELNERQKISDKQEKLQKMMVLTKRIQKMSKKEIQALEKHLEK